MTTKWQLEWRKLFLILTVLPCCRSLEVSIPQEQYEVASGGEVTFSCSFVPARQGFTIFILTWKAYPDVVGDPLITVATYYINNAVDIAPAYEGRAVLKVDMNRQTSTLTLTKVTMKDNRHYQCSVMIPKDDEGTTAATTSLLVLVAPSVPICRIQGKAEYWQNITLTCMSEEGSPKPAYKWLTYNVDNRPRQFPLKTIEKDGALSLFNISRETSGFFVCTSTNRIGSASCNLTLAVMPATMSTGSTAVIIGGVLAGVVVLGILIFCYCRKKGNKPAEGAPGDMEFHDNDAPEAEQYWDDKSKAETKQFNDYVDENIVPQTNYSVEAAAHKLDDQDQQPESHDRLDDQHDHYSGSRDRLDDKRNHYSGSRDRLDEQRDRYGGSRDRLDDRRDRYGGSREHLDDQHDRYRGSRDRLDDQRENYRGSRDRLDDQRENYRGSRDRLDDQRENYRGSRDRLDDQRENYRGSRDRLDDERWQP